MNTALWIAWLGLGLLGLRINSRLYRVERLLRSNQFAVTKGLGRRDEEKQSPPPSYRTMLDGLRPDGTRERN